MAQDYKVWITPPKSEGGLFTLNIRPNPSPKRALPVARNLLTRTELRDVLIRSFPRGPNSNGVVDTLIESVISHTFDLKKKDSLK
jgi:hypothetical protein